jgi:hypothetical protein
MTNFFRKIWLWVKRQAKKLLVILGFIGIAMAADNLPVNNITADKVAIQFEQATEIKAKYVLNESSLIKTDIKNPTLDKYKGEPKDEVKITIGDNTPLTKTGLLGAKSTTTEFKPNIELKRWNEVSFKIKTDKLLKDVKTKDKKLTFDKEKIKFDTPKISFEMYEVSEGEGGYKYIWYLNEKPASNIVEFEIETSGLDFFYQPPLTQEYQNGYSEEFQKEIIVTETQVKDLDGNVLVERPENVVGSYAVYHSTKGGMNDAYGKDYKTGQAFFIYRPHLIDANGLEAWGILHIENGIYSVEIPQEFLDKAVYPIKSNDTFGYTTAGGTGYSLNTNWAYGSFMNTTASVTGNVDSIQASVNSQITEKNGKFFLVNASTLAIIANSISDARPIEINQHWEIFTYSTKPSVTSGTTYSPWIVMGNDSILLYYNSGTAGDSRYETDNSYASPANPSSTSSSSRSYSIYATYTPSGGGGTAPDPQIIIIE